MSDNIFAIMDKTINSISNVNVRNQAIIAGEFARNNNDVKNATELIKLLGLSARNGDIPIFYTGKGPNGVLFGEDGNDEMQGHGGSVNKKNQLKKALKSLRMSAPKIMMKNTMECAGIC